MHPQAETKAALARSWPPFASAASPATAAGQPHAISSRIFSGAPACYGSPHGLALSSAAPTSNAFHASYHPRHCPAAICGNSTQPTHDRAIHETFLLICCDTVVECYLARAVIWICSLCRQHARLALTLALTPTPTAAPTACFTTSTGVRSITCLRKAQPLPQCGMYASLAVYVEENI